MRPIKFIDALFLSLKTSKTYRVDASIFLSLWLAHRLADGALASGLAHRLADGALASELVHRLVINFIHLVV